MLSPKILELLQNPELAALSQTPALLSYSLYPPGLPLGSLVQIQGQGSTEASLGLLREHPQFKAAWLEERLSAYPPAFVQQGVNLSCLLFVEGGARFAWAAAELLRSGVFKLLVVGSAFEAGENALNLRRLQLGARASGGLVLLTGGIQGPLWPLRLRLECRREGEGLKLWQAEKKAAWG